MGMRRQGEKDGTWPFGVVVFVFSADKSKSGEGKSTGQR
jgi:hypothetical protein